MKPLMITTPKGMGNWTRAGVYKSSKTQTTASCGGSLEISNTVFNISIEPGPNGTSTIVNWIKKDAA